MSKCKPARSSMSSISEIIDIDGSTLEGGGQILRIALSLSAIIRKPIRIKNIRAKRDKPGLKEQHLKGLLLIRDISNGRVKGAELGSTEIEYHPGRITGGSYFVNVRTAGSISLLLQVSLPCSLFADQETKLRLQGGTNAEMAPQIDYTTEIFRPILEKFGPTFDFEMVQRGYFPKGGGEVLVTVKPIARLKSVELLEMGNVKSIYGWSFVAGTLPLSLAHAMTNGATSKLRKICNNVDITTYKESANIARNNCSGIILAAETTTNCLLGGDALGRRGEQPELTGGKAADKILRAVQSKSCLDEYCQDQVIIFMGLAEGCSKIRVGEITLHTQTAIFITELLLGVKFQVEKREDFTEIQCKGCGMTNAYLTT